MNQAQRNFLTDKISTEIDTRIRLMKDGLPERPNLLNYLQHKIMSGDFDISDKETLKQQITERCIETSDGKEWNTGGRSGGWNSERGVVSFKLEDFFIIPDEFQNKLDKYERETAAVNEEIRALRIQSDTLIVRIKLASNSVLESMIQEVDDMGNISLMDTKLKALGSGQSEKP